MSGSAHTEDFLNFDEAVEFLRTTPSTLYKWLQADKIPAHKLGRQWRFVRRELEAHLAGHSGGQSGGQNWGSAAGPGTLSSTATRARLHQEILKFASFLSNRRSALSQPLSPSKEEKMEFEASRLAESLIWDAFDQQSPLIHISPRAGRYEISYRSNSGLEQLTLISEDLFHALDHSWRSNSQSIHREDSRRLLLLRENQVRENPERSFEEVVQVRYEKLQTANGPRLLLRLWSAEKVAPSLEKAVQSEATRQTFLKWLSRSHGMLVIAGGPASGKTTTTLSMLRHLQEQRLAVFSIEDVAEILIDGVQHVEMAQRSDEALREAFERVYASDPDVVALGMGELGELETPALQSALRAAKSGHLVILHLDAKSHEDVSDRMLRALGRDYEDHLIGISIQRLEPTGRGSEMRATYQLKEYSKLA
ncbi:MAG TPA: ATPase, T2SS/T4P/T4SS family [Pseudobdellovibrionaceae bacterium]|nr:ATPase, T2SS/T4P/T4SS family [Pseudobdellovibrionaceae bacterium]